MYMQKKYLKKDRQYIFDFIQNHPFAVFVLNGERLLATHIPVLTEGNAENFQLFGHIAYNNEQYPHLRNGVEALLIFQGPNAYVSSSWYKEKDVSTWDYSAVHVHVKLTVQTKEELMVSLEKLVAHFEKKQEKPLYYPDIPKGIIEKQLPMITGFTCEPTEIQAIAKLHQGYEKKDISSITTHLEKENNPMDSEVGKNIKKEHENN